VCHHCGERYFDRDTIRLFDETTAKLERGDLTGFRNIGSVLEPLGTSRR
jgi:hypothetical protein